MMLIRQAVRMIQDLHQDIVYLWMAILSVGEAKKQAIVARSTAGAE